MKKNWLLLKLFFQFIHVLLEFLNLFLKFIPNLGRIFDKVIFVVFDGLECLLLIREACFILLSFRFVFFRLLTSSLITLSDAGKITEDYFRVLLAIFLSLD